MSLIVKFNYITYVAISLKDIGYFPTTNPEMNMYGRLLRQLLCIVVHVQTTPRTMYMRSLIIVLDNHEYVFN